MLVSNRGRDAEVTTTPVNDEMATGEGTPIEEERVSMALYGETVYKILQSVRHDREDLNLGEGFHRTLYAFRFHTFEFGI